MRPNALPIAVPRRLTLMISTATLAVFAACGGDSATKVVPVESVTVTAPTTNLVPDETVQLQYSAKDASGNSLTDRSVAWSSSSNAIATVSASGLVTAITPGSASITATVDGKSGSVSLMIVPPPVATVTVTAQASEMLVHETQTVSAELKDSRGRLISGRSISWSTSDANIATVSSAGLVSAVGAGAAIITATAEGKTGQVQIGVSVQPVATVTIGGSAAAMLVQDTVALSVVLKDQLGNTLTDRPVTWASSTPAAAVVSATGQVIAVAPGQSTISATSEGKSASYVVTVSLRPVTTVELSSSTRVMLVAETRTVTATLKDDRGAVVTGRSLNWMSADQSVATVSQSGVVTAVGLGDTEIRATSEGVTGTSPISVRAVRNPEITAVSAMSGLATVTITGMDFAPTVGGNTVTVRGDIVPITAATSTQLTVKLPCIVSGAAAVQVTRGAVASNEWPGTVSNQQAGAIVGEPSTFTVAQGGCVELPPAPADGRLLMMTANTGTVLNSVVTSRILTVNTGVPADRVRELTMAESVLPTGVGPQLMTEEARRDAEHMRHMERQRNEYAALLARMPDANRLSVAREQQAEVPSVGDLRTFRYNYNMCGSGAPQLQARAVYVGDKGVVWEDVTNTLQAAATPSLKAAYDRIGEIFDNELYYVVKENFADPLLRDAETDGDGLLHMLFTERLNGSGAAAYVAYCDQYPTSVWAGSNYNQMFYATVPVDASPNSSSTQYVNGWFYFMVRTVVHEVKHVASASARMKLNAASFEESWIEEGSARMAEEMWVRPYMHKTAWKGNAGWGSASTNGVYCDFFPDNATCNSGDPLRRPSYGMRRQFNEILPKLQQPYTWSPYGQATGQTGSVFYQTVWSLLRYTMDQYATTEAGFLQALTNTTSTGVANLTARAGVGIDQLITNWGMALYTDDYPGMPKTNLATQFQTWDLRSIYAGLNDVWSSRFTTPFPIVPLQATYEPFVATASMRSGGHAYFELIGGSSEPILIELEGTSTTRLVILRLK